MPQVVPEFITRLISVSPVELSSDAAAASNVLSRSGAAGTAWMRTLAASLTHNVLIPLPGQLLQAYAAVGTGWPYQALGLKVNSLTIAYRCNTTTITSFDAKVYAVVHPVAAAIGVPVVRTGTLAGNTLTAAANAYNAVLTVTNPVYESGTNALVYGEAIIVTPASSTVDVLEAIWNVDIRLFP